MTERAFKSMRDRLGMGGIAERQTFDNFLDRPELTAKERASLQKARQRAETFLENPRSFVFYGPNGIGKSHLACAIGNSLIERYGAATVPVYFITFDDALRQIRSTFQDGYQGMGEGWYLERWRSVPVLILDEVGQKGRDRPAADGEFTRRIGYDIIDGRYRQGLPTVLTTNKGPQELGQWITASAVDRLFEGGVFVKMEGASWRVKRKQSR